VTASEFDCFYKDTFDIFVSYCENNYYSLDAEDVVQESFTKILSKLHHIRPNKEYFFRVVENVAKQKLRTQSRYQKRLEEYEKLDQSEQEVYNSSRKEEFLETLKLKSKDQELFNMVFLKNKKQSEVAKILKTTENNVNVKVFRLKNKILKMYQEKTAQND